MGQMQTNMPPLFIVTALASGNCIGSFSGCGIGGDVVVGECLTLNFFLCSV